MTQQQSDGFTPEEWAMHKAAQIWCEPEHENKVMDVKFALSIARDLQQAREAERKAIVEWLRKAAGVPDVYDEYDLGWSGGILSAAGKIKRGEHLQKGKS